MRRLVKNGVIASAGLRGVVELGAHFARDPGLDLRGELALLELVIGPIEREAEQRIAELIGIGGVQIHIILTIRQVLARQTDAGRVIPPFERSLLPLRAPIGFARALRYVAERPDGLVAIAAKG